MHVLIIELFFTQYNYTDGRKTVVFFYFFGLYEYEPHQVTVPLKN